jgi:hypothetical protein
MPATSKKQRELMAIAEHHPEKVHKANHSVLEMSHEQLHDYADTKGLSENKSKKHRPGQSLIDVTDINRNPVTSNDACKYTAMGSANRVLEPTAIPVHYDGPETHIHIEELDRDHYGRDYEPAPFKDLFKTEDKSEQRNIRQREADEYFDRGSPGYIRENLKLEQESAPMRDESPADSAEDSFEEDHVAKEHGARVRTFHG